ncbi:hypothetical protein ACFOVU_17570 [Nocardiopsis sediminis]|uniref:Uncharacterized protein n=1 Tax=Nocardiopsis sediminis TaxID=1778267 RepID=A0ABV8FNR6_9ACTN
MDSSTIWVIMFGVPIIAIVVIIGFALHHSSEVREDERDDRPGPE